MRLETQVKFDREEQREIQGALVHIRISFPEPQEAPEARALRLAATGEAVTYGLLKRCEAALFALIADTARESDPDIWWRPAAPEGMPTSTLKGVPLVADPEGMAKAIAGIRETQKADAQRALQIIHDALGRVPEPQPEEEA